MTREVTTNITREITRASTLPEEDEDYDAIEEQEVDEVIYINIHIYRILILASLIFCQPTIVRGAIAVVCWPPVPLFG